MQNRGDQHYQIHSPGIHWLTKHTISLHMMKVPLVRLLISSKGVVYFLSLMVMVILHPQKVAAQEDEGKKLFQVCAACHTIGGGKLIGPDLKGVTERREEEWLIKFIQNSQAMVEAGDELAIRLYEEYNNIPMPPNDYTDEQVRTLLAYIENYGKEPTEPVTEETEAAAETKEKESFQYVDYSEIPPEIKYENKRNYRTIFLISLALMVLAIIDLAVTRLIKARFVNVIIILIAVFIMGEIIVVEAQGLGRQLYYSPDQPVAFSHRIHAGENQIDCQYCHFTAETSKHAGIPPVQLCMNCHNVVKEGTNTGTEEIAKIYEAIENNRSIRWIRVHNVPDHAYFNHAQHVNAGNIECEECHGEVEKMDRIIQIEDLGMGWCVNCHRDTEIDLENPFYDHYVRLHEMLKSGEREVITVDIMGGNDCQRCHY